MYGMHFQQQTREVYENESERWIENYIRRYPRA